MDINEILAAIRGIEGGEDWATGIESHMSNLTELSGSAQARIEELENLNQSLEASIREQKARNYDLLMGAATPEVTVKEPVEEIEDDSKLEIFGDDEEEN
jgi:hypothetical protein